MTFICGVKIDINLCETRYVNLLLSFEWNSIRLGGPAHEIGTKTVHKTLPGGGGGIGGGGLGWGSRGWWGMVVGSRSGGGLGGGGGMGVGGRSRIGGGPG